MFLKPDTLVIPTQAHDYPEWHRGRQHYALWYLELHDPALFSYLNDLRYQCSDLLFQPNTRQFHITLFICGFYTEHPPIFDDDFSQRQFKNQIQHLDTHKLTQFKLKTDRINSFDSALFVEVEDSEQMLSQIRSIFSADTQEIAPLSYCPHITLGLYKHEMPSQRIFERIQAMPQQQFEFEVQQLTFGIYQAQQLQGPLTELYHYPLRSL